MKTSRFEEYVKQNLSHAIFFATLGVIMLIGVTVGLVILVVKVGFYRLLSSELISMVSVVLMPIVLFSFSVLFFIKYRKGKKNQKDFEEEEKQQSIVS